MTAHKLIWIGSRDALEAAGVALSEIVFPPADAVSLIKNDAAADDAETSWRLEAYFVEEPDVEKICKILSDSDFNLPNPDSEELPDIDWVAHSLEGLGVVRAGRFLLYGVHDEEKIKPGPEDIAIRIDANQAFGTGHHPTTAGCLELLSRFAGFRPQSVFDLGCGSAVLSIAAAKLWMQNILASDIDARSVEIAAENAALNGVSERVDAITATGFDHPKIAAAAPFDFVFANILAGPLVELSADMATHVKKNGRVMLAGLMAEQEEKVTAAYDAAGFRLINRLEQDVWPVLLFVRA